MILLNILINLIRFILFLLLTFLVQKNQDKMHFCRKRSTLDSPAFKDFVNGRSSKSNFLQYIGRRISPIHFDLNRILKLHRWSLFFEFSSSINDDHWAWINICTTDLMLLYLCFSVVKDLIVIKINSKLQKYCRKWSKYYKFIRKRLNLHLKWLIFKVCGLFWCSKAYQTIAIVQ